jgi:hypothetical protein
MKMPSGCIVSASSKGTNRGSEFTVRLPVMVESPQSAARGSDPSVCRRIEPRRILIVDDNEDAAATLAALIRIADHQMILAHDGERNIYRRLA